MVGAICYDVENGLYKRPFTGQWNVILPHGEHTLRIVPTETVDLDMPTSLTHIVVASRNELSTVLVDGYSASGEEGKPITATETKTFTVP